MIPVIPLQFYEPPTRPILAASPLHWACRETKKTRKGGKKEGGTNRNVCLTQRKGSMGRRGGSVQGGKSQGHGVTGTGAEEEQGGKGSRYVGGNKRGARATLTLERAQIHQNTEHIEKNGYSSEVQYVQALCLKG